MPDERRTIEFTETVSGTYWGYRKGKRYTLPKKVAWKFVRLGHAEYVEAEPEPAPRAVEAATMEAPERAVTHADVERRVAPRHVGGGWYELPSGERVQGKDAAEEAARELEEDE